MNLSTEKKIMDMENRLVVAKGEGEGVGWIGSFRLMDANYSEIIQGVPIVAQQRQTQVGSM